MEQLHVLVTSELPAAQHSESVGVLIQNIQHENVSILQLVTALGPYLTSDDDAVRTRAINVLAQTVVAAPQLLRSAGDVEHLANFFTGRLADWPAVRGALSGCLALMRLVPNGSNLLPGSPGVPIPATPGVELSRDDVIRMMAAFADHVFVRSLAQQDRHLALSLLCQALEVHGQTVLDSRQVDLMELVIASVDGEKDPRCLLLGLRCVRCVVELYSRQPHTSLSSQKLEESADELFDVSAAYFPIAFTPPPNDPHGITRQQLASALEDTLVATPLFAPHLLPLALEKLSSSVKQAKLDSLSVLGACAVRWGHAPLAGHVSAMWDSIKGEMRVGGRGLSGGGGTEGGDAEVQDAASQCLSRCLEAFGREGHWALLNAVWEDAAVQDMLACLPPPQDLQQGGGAEASEEGAAAEKGGTVFARRVARVRAGARVLSAGCQAGHGTASRLYRLVLPKVLPLCCGASEDAGGVLGPSQDALESRCLALAVLLCILRAAGRAQAGQQPDDSPQAAVQQGAASPSSDGREGGAALPLVREAFQAALQGGAVLCSAADEGGQQGGEGQGEGGEAELWVMERGGYTPLAEARLRLRTIHAFFALPAASSQLPAELLGEAADLLVGCIVAGGGAASAGHPDAEGAPGGALPPPGAAATSLAGAATAALCTLAGHTQHAELVEQRALPQLVAAATGAAGQAPLQPPAGPYPHPREALAAVQALAGSSPSLHTATITHLDSAIQRLLPQTTAHPGPNPPPGQVPEEASLEDLLPLLLATAQGVVVAGGERGEVAPLAVHLLHTTLQDVSGTQERSAAGMGDALTAACCSLVFHAVRLTDEAGQHALLAASPLLLASLHPLTQTDQPPPPPNGHATLRIAACAAALCGLRPAVLSSPSCSWTPAQLGALVGALLRVALLPGGGAGAEPAPHVGWAMLAAASLLNKWKPDSAEFHRHVHRLLEHQLFPLTLGAPGSPQPDTVTAPITQSPTPLAAATARQAWACLALVTKGLAMRGHPAGDGILAGTLSMLREAEMARRAGGEADLAAVWAGEPGGMALQQAADLFGEVLSPAGDGEAQRGGSMVLGEDTTRVAPGSAAAVHAGVVPPLGPLVHAVERPLWQQRTYTMQCAALLGALSAADAAGTAGATAATAGCGAAGGDGSPVSPLTLALAQLLRGAPHAVLRNDWQRALPWVVACLGELLRSWGAQGHAGQGQGRGAGGRAVGLVHALLGTLCEALMEEEGRELCEGLLPRLVPVLLGLLGFRASAPVRERAAQALLLAVQLPYSALHPHKRAVLRGLTQALDDDRRAVRQQAAQAKQAWAT